MEEWNNQRRFKSAWQNMWFCMVIGAVLVGTGLEMLWGWRAVGIECLVLGGLFLLASVAHSADVTKYGKP